VFSASIAPSTVLTGTPDDEGDERPETTARARLPPGQRISGQIDPSSSKRIGVGLRTHSVHLLYIPAVHLAQLCSLQIIDFIKETKFGVPYRIRTGVAAVREASMA
jgi:hypothetical protein